ncbi:MAG: ABC transporter permease [Candidatus Omnitrophica bacterium]|nr:ABC transporter permease [Candidatus Omnitrophota bacterium]MBU1924619.1 ABC transporter permease [Candidatus Omnitrophota bacterium]MBU2063717.1 ABC transporter permease [Candidatus Omnitrophota bacterium]
MGRKLPEIFIVAKRKIATFLEYVGGVILLFVQTLKWTFTPPFKRRPLIEQMEKTGVNSFSIVFLTAFFTGIVLAFQTAYTMKKMSAEIWIASLVGLSMTRELGPVLTALVVAARVGAAIAAEVGTMKVTEQIDALETLATNPVKYLIVPRFLALAIMLPILTVYADFVGMFGGFIVGVSKLQIPPHLYIKKSFDALVYKDIFAGLLKSLIFAFIISIIACYEGMRTKGGAEGVGKSTTMSVVNSCILIIAFDCFFTALFYFLW